MHERQASAFLSTPSARRATFCRAALARSKKFLSTPSARRATPGTISVPGVFFNFYPRPPRGGRPHFPMCSESFITISIHALREEGDSKNGEKHLRFCFIIKRSAQIWKTLSKNIRKNSCMVRRRRKRGECFPFAPRERARRSARLRIQTGDEPRCARPWSYSCCPVDKTADCPDRGR